MLAVVTIVMASCASDIENTTAPTSKSNIQLVVGDFPTFGDSQTRTIGTADKGKTSWAVGDELLLEIDNTSYGSHSATFTYNGESWELTSGELVYREGDPAYIPHVYYAPNYKWANNTLMLKAGKAAGTDEYIEGTAKITNDGKTITVSFAKAIRNYSRLRIATMANKPITVVAESFTPAGDSNTVQSETYSLTSDDNGNAFLYGSFGSNSSVTVKYNDASLATHTFSEATENATSYALDASVVSVNSTDELKDAIAQKIAEGTIRLDLTSITGDVTDVFDAIRESLADVNNGSIDLVLFGVESISKEAFAGVDQLASVILPDAKVINGYAFADCQYLTTVEAPSLNKLYECAFTECDSLSKLVFGPIDYATGLTGPLFDDNTSNIDLILSDNQKELEETDLCTYTPANEREYAGSSEHNSKEFLGYTFKSITCVYKVE